MRLKINEAIQTAKDNGQKVLKKDIAARLFPNASKEAQVVNLGNLCNGKTKRIEPEMVVIICEMCGCTPNFLFDYGN